MNQIPNIEEEIAKLSVEEYRSLILKEMKEALQNSLPFAVNTEFPSFMAAFEKMIDGYADKINQTLHQQLQKARQDWLREEIVKLEGMKEDEKTMLGEEIRHMRKGRNVIIQTIINRYHSELDQDKTNGF